MSDKLQSTCFGRPQLIRMGDFDVSLPSPRDFPVYDVSAKVFTQAAKLSIIMGRIAEYSMQASQISQQESSALITSLCNWLRDLPADVRLYDSTYSKNPYNRPVVELHIIYFVSIVLLQALHKEHDKQWRTSLPSIVASSCIARLNEELSYREDEAFLMPIHAFYCMVAAVPLLYYQPQSAEREAIRQEELGIICSVVERMCARYGGSNTVSRNIARLKTEREKSMQGTSAGVMNSSSWTAAHFRERIDDLFNFPADLCPAMELLRSDTNSQADYSLENILLFDNGFPEWLFSSEPFVDPFGIGSPFS